MHVYYHYLLFLSKLGQRPEVLPYNLVMKIVTSDKMLIKLLQTVISKSGLMFEVLIIPQVKRKPKM